MDFMKRFISVPLGFLLLIANSLQAQFEVKTGNFNNLWQGAVPTVLSPAPTPDQFASVGQVTGSSGPINATSSPAAVYADQYPSNPANTIVLTRSSMGVVFASGTPRYGMGDEILPPPTQIDGVTSAASDYWRAQPILPGELINSTTLISLGTVSVTSASTLSPIVIVALGGTGLDSGATMLGQSIVTVVGTTVTLAGNANANISSPTAISITPAVPFYYSPHAEKVFASQPGGVTITWVTRLPISSVYGTKTESFAVASGGDVPSRSIFWTEGSFDGPRVKITDGRITTASPIYNIQVPMAVAQEVRIPGYTPITQNLSTLKFEKINGIGQLRAYNVEGRVLVEYLGNLRVGNSIYEHLGMEVVEISRVPPATLVTTDLGDEILPHDGDRALEASPIINSQQNSASLYGTLAKTDNTFAYYAERATSEPRFPDNGEPQSADGHNKVVFYWLEKGNFGIQWPKFQDRYWQRWSPNLTDYAHYTVDASGSTPETGVSFQNGAIPELIYQDDTSQTEAKIDVTSQRFVVHFNGGDMLNRSLLKFSNASSLWYVNLYSQGEQRSSSRSSTANNSNTLTLPGIIGASGLEIGMVVSGPGITESATVTGIINVNTIVVSQNVNTTGNGDYTFTVESDSAAPINSMATVGTRIGAPAGHETGGYISGGMAYYPAGYINPFVSGVSAANKGAIIPVNARPDDKVLTVRWFKKAVSPSANFQDFYVPGKIGRYTLSFPSVTVPEIVIAQGVGTDDLPPAESLGSVYYQNDSNKAGFNPNEEHAFMLGGRAYALREDLNITRKISSYTSLPCVLVAYTNPLDNRPSIHTYLVSRTNATYDFDYATTAGTLLIKPYPLPLMSLPLEGVGTARKSKDIEITNSDDPANETFAQDNAYKGFTFQDRKGFTWVHRGPHAGGSPTLNMKLYYVSQEGFYLPGATSQPAAGTIFPFLRNSSRSGEILSLSSIDKDEQDEPLLITYRPTWPEFAPALQVNETLALPKFGLPQVRGQSSAEIIYQQSLAVALTASQKVKTSVTLHDSTREKFVALDAPSVGLTELPKSIRTTVYQGKVYFQGLPPHLQKRFYADLLRGEKGTLVLIGEFHDEIAGEDYLDLNLLSQAEEGQLKALVSNGDPKKSSWDAAINGLSTRVETFKENPQQAGSFIPDVVNNQDVGENDLVKITSSDTAVDSYALTASGQGIGYVTMVFGNGDAFTDSGDPVQVKILKVVPQLYTGDLKVLIPSNPLDEQVTLRHSADYMGKPEDYEFDWRWTTGASSAPSTYSTVMTQRLGAPTGNNHLWRIVSDPGTQRPSPAQYAAETAVPLPRSINVHPSDYTDTEKSAGLPSVVLRSEAGVNFAAGVPGSVIFSADIGALDGFVLYVNGTVALASDAPTPLFNLTNSSTGLAPSGLPKQFDIPRSFFNEGPNTIEVAIYTQADPAAFSNANFRIDATQETDIVTNGNVWQIASDPQSINTNTAVVGGSPVNPFGGSTFVLNDRWFTMRYRAKATSDNILGTQWSRWMAPKLSEGWVKRVLAAINPFEQRVKDLYNNAVNTDVSVITQAGKRWEGDIALTLGNINDVGLIEIYETVLNRARAFSIDANTNDPDSNNALLLATGYLNDLYTLLGNEAFADASNPTISIEEQGLNASTQVNTSRFSFEGQVANSLDEEMALLRGRDDFVSPGVSVAPAYNRLYWNYTRGINGGEAIYALNYNIKEKVASSTANGVIDEADAQRMFPQGHGDAYGHYLTGLKGYFKLLTNPNFTWTPRAEAVTVLGQAVTVDYFDERKLAMAAGNVARMAQQVINLTWRQQYQDNTGSGWAHFRDRKGTNTQTNVTSRQGMDEWVSRGAQSAYYSWAVANALLPVEDNIHTGIQKIDRSTVPEILELPSIVESIQTTADNASAHLNPLGLSPGAIAFDISPADLSAGISHYEQISSRALVALNNAAGAFNQAAVMTGALRNQENSLDEYNNAIYNEESAYEYALIDIFGRPYSGEVGPGKLYAQGYTGPDLTHWYIVDRPNDLVDTGKKFSINIREAVEIQGFSNNKALDILSGVRANGYTLKTVTVNPSQFIQYNELWKPGGLGSRPEVGELQLALQDSQLSYLSLSGASVSFQKEMAQVKESEIRLTALVNNYLAQVNEMVDKHNAILAGQSVALTLETTAQFLDLTGELTRLLGDAIGEYAPIVNGVDNDYTSSIRGTAKQVAANLYILQKGASNLARIGVGVIAVAETDTAQTLEENLARLGFNNEELQSAHEYTAAYREMVTHSNDLMQLTLEHHRNLQNVSNVLAKGDRLLASREISRQRAAAIIQGYRVRDVSFRIFRNEALEQYRTLFDLASRYTYLAAKSYDYETGLLGNPQGQSVFKSIVSSRALGDLTGGTPQASTSTIGDSGLAGTVARLNADFSVAEGRLGVNNPDQNSTVFSLRSELFRLLNLPTATGDDEAWRQTIEQHIIPDVMADADVAAQCRNIRKPDGTPVPGIVIPFSTTIEHGLNYFGLDLAGGDHAFSPSNFATKIYQVGISFPGYVGMDAFAIGGQAAGSPTTADPNSLSATPYVYLIPCGNDHMLAPPFGDTNMLRSWKVDDQALPLPYNLGASAFNTTQFFSANDTLREKIGIVRKHQAFRAVNDPGFFFGDVPAEFTSSRLIGRSVWNGKWKLVIPAYTLLNNEQEGLNRFAGSVKDVQLFLRTYSNSGN
jgi:hypothetical protein